MGFVFSFKETIVSLSLWRPTVLSGAALLCATVLGVGTAGVASAAPPVARDETPALLTAPPGSTESCVKAAVKRKTQRWTCIGPVLKTGDKFETIALDPAAASEARSKSGATNRAFEEDDDTWCEFGSVCTNNINSYSSKTKGNAAYGDGDGLVGNYDLILKTNLNGRQAQWTVTIIHDNGPGIIFNNQYVNCFEQVQLFPDSVCGAHSVPDAYVTSSNRTFNSGILYGSYLSDSSTYYGAYNGQFYPVDNTDLYLSAGELESQRFNCFGRGDDICYFP